MINFTLNISKYESELRDIIRMFVPFFEMDLNISLLKDGNSCNIKIENKSYLYEIKSSDIKKELKKCLYLALSHYFGKELPWGSLTGIRPSKVVYKFLDEGGKKQDIVSYLQNEYFVTKAKAKLIQEIIASQEEYLTFEQNKINLYVHIPFCPTKCDYCSFFSLVYSKNQNLVDNYLDLLCKEIEVTKELIKRQNKEILSVYIGGGTPSVLSEQQIQKLLSAIDYSGGEYTFEAGRVDTINAKKLDIIKKYGVNRICLNPQTFNQKTLEKIGRSHSLDEFYKVYNLAKQYSFDINMDLIAALPNENEDDVFYSVNQAVKLKPENITLHTLSIKRGSALLDKGIRPKFSSSNALDIAYQMLKDNGYLPYYLYRQKNMADNLENCGFCLGGKQSVNNINTMEESISVYASGAGAISKKVVGDRIIRLAHLRDINLYIKEFDARLKKKLRLFEDTN